MVKVRTSRIDYKGKPNQLVLNTTIKSGDGVGKVFAPTWDMVMQSKRGEITWSEYTEQYLTLMRERYIDNKQAFIDVLNHSEELVLCCYCKNTHGTTEHCHRYILVSILEKVALRHNIDFEYVGEVYNK